MDFEEIISRIPEIRLRHLINLPSIFIDGKSKQNFYLKCPIDEDNQLFPQHNHIYSLTKYRHTNIEK